MKWNKTHKTLFKTVLFPLVYTFWVVFKHFKAIQSININKIYDMWVNEDNSLKKNKKATFFIDFFFI